MKTLTLTLMMFTEVVASASTTQKGIASWYGKENYKSCTGKRLEHKKPALAHKTLPMGTVVKITDTKTKKSVVAVVEDRGPYISGRIADLNIPAAKELGILKCGIAKVTLEKVK
jgi:rare lipoprotein A